MSMINIPKAIYGQAQALATSEGTTVNAVVKRAIERELQPDQREKASSIITAISDEFEVMHDAIQKGMNAAVFSRMAAALEKDPTMARVVSLMKYMIHEEHVTPDVAAVSIAKIFYGRGT